MMEFIKDNWQAIAAFLAPFLTFFTGWKLRKINEQKEGATALQSVQNVYDTLTKQIDDEVRNFRKEISDLKEENREQRTDIRSLQKDNSGLHLQVSRLIQENNDLKLKVRALEDENEQLRRIKANKT